MVSDLYPIEYEMSKKPIEVLENGMKVWGKRKARIVEGGKSVVREVPFCNAPKRNKPGMFCQSTQVIHPSGRCRLHGGKSLSGLASGRFVHGRTSQHFGNKKFGEKVSQLLQDEKYLSMRFDIATCKARLAEMEENLRVSLDEVTIDRLRKIAAQSELALKEEDKVKRRKILEGCAYATIELANAGTIDKAWWSEYQKTQTHLSNLITAERATLKEREASFSVTEVWAMFGEFLGLIKKLEDDRDRLTKYAQGVSKILQSYDLPQLPETAEEPEVIEAEIIT